MSTRPAAIFAICLICVAASSSVYSVDQQDVLSGKTKSRGPAEADQKADDPPTVVAKWIDLVRQGNVGDSWALTTNAVGLDAHHELPRLRQKDQIHVERSLGTEAVTVVVTNTVKHIASGRDRAFAFWLVRRDGLWLIDMSYIDDPKNIEQQLSGFYMSGGVKWRVSRDDLVGTWLAGPGPAGGIGGIVCGSRFQFLDDGSFTLETWGPGGPSDGTKFKQGSWTLEEDRIIRVEDKQRLVSRISWVGQDSLVLQPAKVKSRDGHFGTFYQRKKVVKARGEDRQRPVKPSTKARQAAIITPADGHDHGTQVE